MLTGDGPLVTHFNNILDLMQTLRKAYQQNNSADIIRIQNELSDCCDHCKTMLLASTACELCADISSFNDFFQHMQQEMMIETVSAATTEDNPVEQIWITPAVLDIYSAFQLNVIQGLKQYKNQISLEEHILYHKLQAAWLKALKSSCDLAVSIQAYALANQYYVEIEARLAILADPIFSLTVLYDLGYSYCRVGKPTVAALYLNYALQQQEQVGVGVNINSAFPCMQTVETQQLLECYWLSEHLQRFSTDIGQQINFINTSILLLLNSNDSVELNAFLDGLEAIGDCLYRIADLESAKRCFYGLLNLFIGYNLQIRCQQRIRRIQTKLSFLSANKPIDLETLRSLPLVDDYRPLLSAVRVITVENVSDADQRIAMAKLTPPQQAELATLEQFQPTQRLAQGIAGCLKRLFNDAQRQLGPPPCQYAILSLGSLARRACCCYSDFEFAIVRADEVKTDIKPDEVEGYFQALVNLVELKIIGLGETPVLKEVKKITPESQGHHADDKQYGNEVFHKVPGKSGLKLDTGHIPFASDTVLYGTVDELLAVFAPFSQDLADESEVEDDVSSLSVMTEQSNISSMETSQTVMETIEPISLKQAVKQLRRNNQRGPDPAGLMILLESAYLYGDEEVAQHYFAEMTAVLARPFLNTHYQLRQVLASFLFEQLPAYDQVWDKEDGQAKIPDVNIKEHILRIPSFLFRILTWLSPVSMSYTASSDCSCETYASWLNQFNIQKLTAYLSQLQRFAWALRDQVHRSQERETDWLMLDPELAQAGQNVLSKPHANYLKLFLRMVISIYYEQINTYLLTEHTDPSAAFQQLIDMLQESLPATADLLVIQLTQYEGIHAIAPDEATVLMWWQDHMEGIALALGAALLDCSVVDPAKIIVTLVEHQLLEPCIAQLHLQALQSVYNQTIPIAGETVLSLWRNWCVEINTAKPLQLPLAPVATLLANTPEQIVSIWPSLWSGLQHWGQTHSDSVLDQDSLEQRFELFNYCPEHNQTAYLSLLTTQVVRSIDVDQALHQHYFEKLPTSQREYYLYLLAQIFGQADYFVHELNMNVPAEPTQQLIHRLASIPERDGNRITVTKHKAQWVKKLKTLLVDQAMADHYRQSMQEPLIEVISAYNGRGFLHPLCVQKLIAQGWMNEQGYFIPKKDQPERIKGRHIVVPVTFTVNNKLLAFYFKVEPEMPGNEYAAIHFIHLLTGQGAPMMELMRMKPESDAVSSAYVTVLVSEAMVGNDLTHWLQQEEDLDWQTQLNAEMLSRSLLAELLTNQEDGKGDNVIVIHDPHLPQGQQLRLAMIDNDRRFYPGVLNEQAQVKLIVKNSLFCLDAMQARFSVSTISDFLALDAHAFLSHWLTEQIDANQHFCDLFSEDELKQQFAQIDQLNQSRSWIDKLLNRNELPELICLVPIQLLSFLAEKLYIKICYTQKLLRNDDTLSVLDLLKHTERYLGQYYERLLDEYPTPIIRFEQGMKPYYELSADGEEITQTPTLPTLLGKPVWRERLMLVTPDVLKEKLNQVHEHYLDAVAFDESNNIYQQLISRDNATVQSGLECLTGLHFDALKIKVINRLYSKRKQGRLTADSLIFNKDVEALLIAQLSKVTEIDEIILAGCQQLTDKLLLGILANNPEICTLDLSGCVLLTAYSINQINYYCPCIESLDISGIPKLRRLRLSNAEKPNETTWQKLSQLIITNTAVKEIILIAPQLEILTLSQSNQLTTLRLVQTPRLAINYTQLQIENQLNPTLRTLCHVYKYDTLNLASNKISRQMFLQLLELLIDQEIRLINFADNSIDDVGAAWLAEMLPRLIHIKQIVLSGNPITKIGVTTITSALKEININCEIIFGDDVILANKEVSITDIENWRKIIINGSLSGFMQLPTSIKGKIINGIIAQGREMFAPLQLRQIHHLNHRRLIQVLRNIQLTRIDLSECSWLTDKLFDRILQGQETLIFIDISSCEQLTVNAFRSIAKYCQNVEVIIAKNLRKIKEVTAFGVFGNTTLSFPYLAMLDFAGCDNLDISKVKIDGPPYLTINFTEDETMRNGLPLIRILFRSVGNGYNVGDWHLTLKAKRPVVDRSTFGIFQEVNLYKGHRIFESVDTFSVFDSFSKAQARDSQVIILFFDTPDYCNDVRTTKQRLLNFSRELVSHAETSNVIFIIVGLIPPHREDNITFQQGEDLALEVGAVKFFLSSFSRYYNVQEIYEFAAEAAIVIKKHGCYDPAYMPLEKQSNYYNNKLMLHHFIYYPTADKLLALTHKLGVDAAEIISFSNEVGWTALHSAVSYRSDEVIFYLMKYLGARVAEIIATANNGGETVLHLAAQHQTSDEVVMQLLRHLGTRASEIILKPDTNGLTVLHIAIRRQKIDTFELLFQCLLRIMPVEDILSLKDENIDPVLHFGLRERKSLMIKHLLKLYVTHGCENLLNETRLADQRTPLLVSARYSTVEIVKLLFEQVVKIKPKQEILKQTDKDDNSALCLAAMAKHSKVVALLLELGFDVNHVNKFGLNPLYYTLKSHNINLAELLVNNGANPLQPDKYGILPIQRFAASDYCIKIVEYLLSINAYIVDDEPSENLPLHHIISYEPHRARSLLEQATPQQLATLTQPDSLGNTALHCAAGFGSREIFALLLEVAPHILDVLNLGNQIGHTPLHLAVMRDSYHSTKIIPLLIKAANINQQDHAGNTALHIAVDCSNLEAVRYLCEHGANSYLQNEAGQTPLDIAEQYHNKKIIAYLKKMIVQQLKTRSTQALPQPSPNQHNTNLSEDNTSLTVGTTTTNATLLCNQTDSIWQDENDAAGVTNMIDEQTAIPTDLTTKTSGQ